MERVHRIIFPFHPLYFYLILQDMHGNTQTIKLFLLAQSSVVREILGNQFSDGTDDH